MGKGKREPNRLVHETSPYLLQHAHNPVDWYPWGPEALERARHEDKPIFLSIGYSACHWCHVMAHESFENEDVAAYLNEHFIPIKVDREERPDLDRVYQEAARLTGAQGGWPLSVFLTPDQQPFWIGTYFPPEDRHGRPGFMRVLRTIARTFSERRAHVDEVAGNITSKLAEASLPEPGTRPDRDLLQRAATSLEQFFDRANGGFGSRPKFPNPTALEVLLRAAYRNKEHQPGARRHYLDLFVSALDHMASGGVYDQLGGGFHRYSVDASWTVPHFEKMLYDNAQLVPLYLAAYQVTGHDRYRQVVTETLDYILREMTDAAGGFYSTQDADTEGREGKFFTWRPAELEEVLGAELGKLAAGYFGVTEEGNFEDGQTVLAVARPVEDLAHEMDLEPDEVKAAVETARRELFKARQSRPRPSTDDKVLVSWNGLMIDAFARAGLALGESSYVAVASRAADFILEILYDRQEHTVRHVYSHAPLDIPGYLDDYSFLVRGLLSVYSATWNVEYLEAALGLSKTALREFWSDETGGFFYTSQKGEELVHRPRGSFDAAVPAAGSVAVHNMVMLEPFSEGDSFGDYVERMFELYGDELEVNPFGLASLVLAHDSYLHGPVEVTVVTPHGHPGLEAPLDLPPEWLALLQRTFEPDLLFTTPAAQYKNRPIWDGKVARDDQLTWYVCQDFSCSPPAFSVDEVSDYLNVRRRGGT